MTRPNPAGPRPDRAAAPLLRCAAALLALGAASLAAPCPLAAQGQPPPAVPQQGAAGERPPAIPPEVFLNQGPVTADEMQLAVEIMKAGRDDPATAAGEVEALARKHGTDPLRAAYVTCKYGAGLLMLGRGMAASQIAAIYGTSQAVPTPAELEVIRSVESRLKAALDWR
ncbi:MAG: hypothetical protein LBG06_08535 [Deltaproteobacteria bacterium]|jgi:hypothetical protein|nr:hypothetical protein [Deltaproteobacteria bacterium]